MMMLALAVNGCGANEAKDVVAETEKVENETSGEEVKADAANSADLESLYSDSYVTLGDYKGIDVIYEVDEPTEEDINNRIESDLISLSEKVDVSSRAVKEGDIVNIDYKGTKDGVAFDGGTASGYDLTIGSGQFIDGFEDGLIGANVGDNIDLNLRFPDAYHSAELAGQEVVFNVTVNSISEEKKPELSDETVAKIGNGYSSVDEYKKEVRNQLYESNEAREKNSIRNEVMNTVVGNATVKEIPDWLLAQEVDSVKSSATSYANMYGISLEDFVSSALNETLDEFEKECAEYGKSNATQILVAYAIAAKENLKVDEAELKEGLEEYMNSYGMSEEELEASGQKAYMTEYLQTSKVSDFLFDNAVFKDAKGNTVTIEE